MGDTSLMTDMDRERQAAATDPNEDLIEIEEKTVFPPSAGSQITRRTLTKQQVKGLFKASIENAFNLHTGQTEEVVSHWIRTHLPLGQIEKITGVAQDVFEDEAIAREWLLEPNLATDNQAPIDLIGSPDGYARVFNLLKRIEYGNLA